MSKQNEKSREYVIAKQLRERAQFYECVRKNNYTDLKLGKNGTYDWSQETYNIKKGSKPCPNDCKYCYIKAMNIRMKKEVDELEDVDGIDDIEDGHNLKCESVPQKVNKNWRTANEMTKKYIMMPSSHDIFDNNVKDICVVTNKMVNAGHDGLIVTKARMSCIRFMIDYFRNVVKNEEFGKVMLHYLKNDLNVSNCYTIKDIM